MEYSVEHFGITVSNLKNSIDFYRNNFNFKEVRRTDKPKLELKLATLQLKNSYLELIQPYKTKITSKNEKYEIENGKLKPKKDSNSLINMLQKSTNHIAIAVNEIHAIYLKLKSNNVELTDFNEKFFFCQDPDGFLIEVRQRK